MESININDAEIGLDQVVYFLYDNKEYIEEAKVSINKLLLRNQRALKLSQIKLSYTDDRNYENLSFSISSNEKMIETYEDILSKINSISLQ